MSAVLVVDDDPRVRDVISELLTLAGCQAAEADEAGRRLETGRFGVVLGDVHIPGRSGMALAGEIRSKFPTPAEAAGIVRAHHEHFDGSGYAQAIAGGDIPLGARIVAVADAPDALTHGCRYRSGDRVDAAVREIRRCLGRQADPAVVDALVERYVNGTPLGA